jgi:hypothetical protein
MSEQVGPRTSLAHSEMVCTGCVYLKVGLDSPAKPGCDTVWEYICQHPAMGWGLIGHDPKCPAECPERKSNKVGTKLDLANLSETVEKLASANTSSRVQPTVLSADDLKELGIPQQVQFSGEPSSVSRCQQTQPSADTATPAGASNEQVARQSFGESEHLPVAVIQSPSVKPATKSQASTPGGVQEAKSLAVPGLAPSSNPERPTISSEVPYLEANKVSGSRNPKGAQH